MGSATANTASSLVQGTSNEQRELNWFCQEYSAYPCQARYSEN
jgi:hypothetical protein